MIDQTARRILVVVGTRPEAIKLAPVIRALSCRPSLEVKVLATSQHKEMLAQAFKPFNIRPDMDLGVMRAGQSPGQVASTVLREVEDVLHHVQPAWVVVQGDTTTAFATATASFLSQVRVAHVEAGLRSGRLDSPFPEEFNRRAISLAASVHFSPTPGATERLLREGVEPERVVTAGNTVVDAVDWIRGGKVATKEEDRKVARVLVTFHRRESFGDAGAGILGVIRDLANARPQTVEFVYPVHPNPAVDGPAREILGGCPNVILRPPMDYPDFLALFSSCRFAMSDSGGVQEESPCLKVPVVVLRDVTERPEVIESGWGILAGREPARIREIATRLLDDDAALQAMRTGPNPFGDGHAGLRIAEWLEAND